MRRPPAARSRGRTFLLTVLPVLLMAVAAGAFAVATRASAINPKGTPFTLDDALEDYRRQPGPLHPDIAAPRLPYAAAPASVSRGGRGRADAEIKGFGVPRPGVYTYATQGSDWIDYEGERFERPFPSTTYATVRLGGGCVWELYFRPLEEHTDAHRQCGGPGEFLCLAHMQKVSFAGISGDEVHRCNPAMIQVGRNASRPGGVEQTVCHAKDNSAKIVIKYIGNENVTVGGVVRAANHVRIDSYVYGEGLNGTAVADVWFDAEDGVYLKLVRSANVHVKQKGGEEGTYGIKASYHLTSLTPRT